MIREIIFGPFVFFIAIFVERPFLAPALVFAAAFGHLWTLKGRSAVFLILPALAACFWILYGFYEWNVPRHANIRVDLLLIAPFLLMVSAMGVVAYVAGVWPPRTAAVPPPPEPPDA